MMRRHARCIETLAVDRGGRRVQEAMEARRLVVRGAADELWARPGN